MNVDYELRLFENAFGNKADMTRNDQGGFESGATSLLWEAWQECAQRIPERRDMRDPRPADDEPRLCTNNRNYFRKGWNAAVESANP